MEPEVTVYLECLGVKGVVSHESSDDLLYCDAEFDNERIVTYGKTFDELVENFRNLSMDVTTQYNEWVASFD